MSLPRIVLAWVVVSLWFLLWEAASRRLSPRTVSVERHRNAAGWFRTYAPLPLGEALLLTLFAALWFASLGHGAWGLLFGLVGLLIEIPSRFRFGHRVTDFGLQRWLLVGLGTVRIIIAGGLLAWRLS